MFVVRGRAVLSLRLDPDGHEALDQIAHGRGVSRAEATDQAIAETAARERRRSGLAAEVGSLMQDQAYVDEARKVVAQMEHVRGTR
jgi:predicted transcriptional regulator